MKKHLYLFTTVVFAVVSLFFAAASMAQTDTTGTVVGTVADQNGAVIPNASVTISGPILFGRKPRHRIQTASTAFPRSLRENMW